MILIYIHGKCNFFKFTIFSCHHYFLNLILRNFMIYVIFSFFFFFFFAFFQLCLLKFCITYHQGDFFPFNCSYCDWLCVFYISLIFCLCFFFLILYRIFVILFDFMNGYQTLKLNLCWTINFNINVFWVGMMRQQMITC